MEKVKVYKLDVRLPKTESQKVKVEETLTVGSDPSANFIIQDQGLAPIHFNFRQQNEVLTLTMLGEDNSAKIGKQKLQQGKMYILDKSDKVNINKVKIVVCEEWIETHTPPTTPPETFEEEIDESSDTQEIQRPGDFLKETTQKIDDDNKPIGLFAKIKEKLQRKSKKTSIKATGAKTGKGLFQKKKPNYQSPPGFFTRIAGISVEVFLAFNLGPLGIQLLGWESKAQKIAEMTSYQLFNLFSQLRNISLPHLDKIKEFLNKMAIPSEFVDSLISLASPSPLFPSIIILLASFAIVRLLPSLIIGMPFPFFLIGVKNQEGSFFKNRLRALAREILGFFTLPFLIFDFPAIFQKRTLKEILTCSRLGHSNLMIRFCGFFILNPLIILATLAIPLQINLKDFISPVELESSLKYWRNKKPRKEETPFVGVSHYWGLQFRTSFDQNWTLIPYPKKLGKNWTLDLLIVDSKNKQQIQFSKGKFLNYDHQIQKFRWFDPFSYLHSQKLSTWHPQDQIEKKSKWTIQRSLEWSEIIEQSVQLSLFNLSQFVFTKGFLFYPYGQLRKDLLELLEERRFEKLEAFKFGSDQGLLIEKGPVTKLLVFQGPTFSTWMVVNRGKKQNLIRKAIKKLFGSAKKVKTSETPNLDKTLQWNGFTALDAFSLTLKSQPLSSKVISNLLRFTLKTAKKALENEEVYLQKQLIRAFKSYDKLLINLIKKQDSVPLKDLRIAFNRTQKALEEKDMKYFEINLQ